MMQQAKISIICCLLIATSLFAEVKDVHLIDGRVIRGEVTETTTGYEVSTSMGSIAYSRGEVRRIEDVTEEETTDPAEEFATRLAALDAEDVSAHVALGRWAEENGLLDEAQGVYLKALELNPDDRYAQLSLDGVNAEIELRDNPVDPVEPKEGDNGTTVAETRLEWLLTKEDVYRIRMAEVRTGDDVRIKFANPQVVRDFSASMEGYTIGEDDEEREFDPAKFLRLRDKEQFYIMLEELGPSDTEYMNDVMIQTDPKTFDTFRRTIWPGVMRSCARSECHGGAEGAGGLKLIPISTTGRSDTEERTYYTNFLILDRSKGSAGKIINRDKPEKSLLLKYGLASDKSDVKHPLVNGQEIPVVFASKEDGKYETALNWITNDLSGPVHPRYAVNFTLPAVKIAAAKKAAEREAAEALQDGDGGDGDGDEPEVTPDEDGEGVVDIREEPVEMAPDDTDD